MAGSISDQTATRSNVASAAADTLIFAANGAAGGRTVTNESSAILYLAYGPTPAASVTSYTVQIAAGAYYEFPTSGRFFGGEVRGIWASANGFARCTEW